MSPARLLVRSARGMLSHARPFSAAPRRAKDLKARGNANTDEWRKRQTERPLNPHLTSTASTEANAMPRVGRAAAPPEMLSAVDPHFAPADAVPGNTEKMTGGAQSGAGAGSELGVGELEGAQLRVEPLRRTGEDPNTMRARLLCPSVPVLRHARRCTS